MLVLSMKKNQRIIAAKDHQLVKTAEKTVLESVRDVSWLI